MRPVLFFLFFVSGFAGLVYQVIWTRLAFASFGIITPVLSVVLSVFMLGLSAGAAAGGRLIPWLTRRMGVSAILFYALAELLIGLGAFAVPRLFAAGEDLLLVAGQTNSFGYLSLSALVLAASILPWCFFMGTTYPFMMAYIRERPGADPASFSFLYVANVLGAMSGTFLTAIVFVEEFGFNNTLHIAAAGNFLIVLISIALVRQQRNQIDHETAARQQTAANENLGPNRVSGGLCRWILFTTGFCAMAMEVVWNRAFTSVLKTQVYSFALIVFAYLGATFIGSLWYRLHLQKGSTLSVAKLMACLVVVALLPVAACDPRLVNMDWGYLIHPESAILILASICPFCALLGYLTPSLIDNYAAGEPGRAGKAYAINVFGCILGPLFASYVLLPQLAERFVMILLSLPFFAFLGLVWKKLSPPQRVLSSGGACLMTVYAVFFSQDFQGLLLRQSERMEVRRDYAASVVSLQETNGEKDLLVNNVGMTSLSPATKFMVDLPLAFHTGDPHSALIICFGMGTTYRAALSWDINATAVELVPDVPRAFRFYHDDAPNVLSNPHGRVVIDDGRRFLMRTRGKYDVIAIDPPPPPETAGSSLLYSTHFYDLIKEHLNSNGIVQIWVPRGEALTAQAVIRSAVISFPHVRCFASFGAQGIHILASMAPIEARTPGQLAARMPERAKEDLLEWSPTRDPVAYLASIVGHEFPPEKMLNADTNILITDDHPFNEYFLLRDGVLY